MLDLADHTAHGRGIFQRTGTVHFVQAETDQGLLLSAGRRIGLPICSTVIVAFFLSAISQFPSNGPCPFYSGEEHDHLFFSADQVATTSL